ncbi:beta-galactosidase [Actinoalloteichus fjordicus]|nr:beta-galactosidase [Actinoalloteichus fjordicus]
MTAVGVLLKMSPPLTIGVQEPDMLSLHVLDHAPPLSGHLPMGTPDGAECSISVDGRAISRAGRRWLPVMGEFHFSRYPEDEWRTELDRIRAGGIDVVATYLFWNHHEPTRGEFRFDSSRDIGRFVRLCGEAGLAVAVRIGPWSHGECRNGGFPDWLADVDCVPRTDDPAYLALVAAYYERIGRELAGLSWADGGPIVAVQVENELYDQPGHLATLRTMAEAAGITAPLWTATGWGAPQLPADVLLPLYGGYPEAFWADATDGWARQMRCHYFFTSIRDDHAIGADLRPATPEGASIDHVPPDDRRYPYATCELGGGMAIAYHRRPLVPAADISALALAKLGSGSVWQGYYLYHGCSQRLDLPTPNQESHACGYPNDLPVVNYDFQAPLGEYGQVRPSFHALRVQHLFLRDSGADLAELPVQLPDASPSGLDDRETVRWSVRSDGSTGFLFVNNHQPHEPLPDHAGVRFEVRLADRTVRLPAEPVTISTGAHFVWPIGFGLAGGQRLDWASAQPLARLAIDGVPTSVFVAADGIPAQFAFAGPVSVDGAAEITEVDGRTVATVSQPGTDARFSVTDEAGGTATVHVLGQVDALRFQRVEIAGTDVLILCDDPVIVDGEALRIDGTDDDVTLAMLPAPTTLAGAERTDDDGVFSAWRITTAGAPPRPRLVRSAGGPRTPQTRTGGPHGRASAPTDEDFEHAAVFHVTVDERAFDDAAELLLRLTYTGDAARAYVGGRLVADHFWFGPDWDVGLRRIAAEVRRHGIEIRVLPRATDARVYVDPAVRHRFAAPGARPEIQHVRLSRTHRITLRPEWEGRDA